MRFGIMFFANSPIRSSVVERYEMIVHVARLADEAGLEAIWTPERHFNPFGGMFPNPALTSAALATVTRRLQLRAGSLISPLHHTIRIAEDWSVVDNLSCGRAAVSFGSGWNVNDFVLAPNAYDTRRDLMLAQVQTVRRLWRGEVIELQNGRGTLVKIRLHPVPVQPELPVWLTSSGNPRTFQQAGEIGANVLTHLIGHDLSQLIDKIKLYRAARKRAKHDPLTGVVSLMLHTFVATDSGYARELARDPFREYLRAAVLLERTAALGGGTISGGHHLPPDAIPSDLIEELLDVASDRYLSGASLIGSPDECAAFIQRLSDAGVDEIACLLDFGLPDDCVLAQLPVLFELAGTSHT